MADVNTQAPATTPATPTTPPATPPAVPAGQTAPAAAIDYEKIASLIAGKQTATEDSVLKGYFKQQGLSQEEMAQAINTFKQQKAAQQPDVGALQQQAAQVLETAKPQAQGTSGFIQVGGNGNQQQNTDEAALKAAFGLK